MLHFAMDDAVAFELAQLRAQDFFADARQQIAKLGKAFRPEAEMPDGQHLPFATDAIDRARYRAAVIIFQRTISGPAGRLTKLCVLPPALGMVIPFHRSGKNQSTGKNK